MKNEILEFGAVTRKPEIRYAENMGEVILDKGWLKENSKAKLYYMYRDLWKKGDKEKIRENSLRYDITIIPPRNIGKEYVKTKGHYHPESSPGITYPELYEVMEGKAHYLLQKRSSKGILEDVFLVEANEGEKALIPPNYGHITINPDPDKSLKMSNWVDRSFDSIYEDILELGGGGYFELTSGEFIKNENYDQVPELRKVKATEIPELGIESGKDMYEIIENPEDLELLKEPEKYESIFEKVI